MSTFSTSPIPAVLPKLKMEAVTNAYNNLKAALSTAPPSDAYLAWDAPGVEEVKPDEEETSQKIGVTMNNMQ